MLKLVGSWKGAGCQRPVLEKGRGLGALRDGEGGLEGGPEGVCRTGGLQEGSGPIPPLPAPSFQKSRFLITKIREMVSL